MIKHILFSGTAALALLAASAIAYAQSVDTRIGKLELQNGYPSKAAVEKLYDEMDFQRATQAFIWALPAVDFHGLHLAHRNTFGAKDGEVVLYQSLKDKAGMLTSISILAPRSRQGRMRTTSRRCLAKAGSRTSGSMGRRRPTSTRPGNSMISKRSNEHLGQWWADRRLYRLGPGSRVLLPRCLVPRSPPTLGTSHGVPYAGVRYVARKVCASSGSMMNATTTSPDAHAMTLA